MNRVTLTSLLEPWPEGDIWMDVQLRDIQSVMIGSIKNADKRIKAISVSVVELSRGTSEVLIRVAAKKGIHIVWVNAEHVRLNPPE